MLLCYFNNLKKTEDKKMIKGNRESLEGIVDKCNPAITDKVSELAEELGKYGFQGKVSIALCVSVTDKTFGGEDALVKREIEFKFQH
jgi:hypothetical protein